MTKMKNSQKSKSKKSTKANDKKLNAKWSKTIQNLTQEVFTDLRIESFFRGFCVLKSDSGFGRITIEDAMNDKYIIREMKSDMIVSEFKKIDLLIKAGWVVD